MSIVQDASAPNEAFQLRIRRAVPADTARFGHVSASAGVFEMAADMPYQHPNRFSELLNISGDFPLVLVGEVEQTMVGHAVLLPCSASRRRTHAAILSVAVLPAWSGRGIASALIGQVLDCADRWYGLVRVELTVLVENTHAIGLYRKFGFEQEGVLKSWAIHEGRLVDALMMARVRIGDGSNRPLAGEPSAFG